jgi:hypothetical protein
MGFRFYRRVNIVPGLDLNLSKHNVSLSAGRRGAHVTIGTQGVRETVGLPGTGMYWTEAQPWHRNVRSHHIVSLVLAIAFFVALFAGWL